MKKEKVKTKILEAKTEEELYSKIENFIKNSRGKFLSNFINENRKNFSTVIFYEERSRWKNTRGKHRN